MKRGDLEEIMRVEIVSDIMKMIELPKPLNLVLSRIVEGEIVLIEYNSLSNVDLLPLKLTSIGNSVFVEIGDKLHVKLYALINALKDTDPELLDAVRRTPIISVSNFTIGIPGFNIVNVPLNEITKMFSKFYSFMKDSRDNHLVVVCGIELIALHFDIQNFLRELAGLKVALPSVTFIGFLNYDAVDKRVLAIFESMATTVVRMEGVVDIKRKKIKKYMYPIKSINPVRCDVVEINHEI